jgi:hypothetical protein
MKSTISEHEMKSAICEIMHNYVSSFGFEEGVKRFAETLRMQADVAESITVEEFNKMTGATI